uniref:Isochorismatase-like domain-containing protein n=1 Tax=Fibrocapsa japonica TaxID=94617 RepID=A0A7S2V3L4_9STRA
MDNIDDIYMTMDCHHRMHIAHKGFWRNGEKQMPGPFTAISHEDVKEKKWKPVQEQYQEHAEWYTSMLEKGGRFTLMVWPEHCLVGTTGNAIVQPINEAVQEWALKSKKTVTYIQKAQHCLTEMYSVFKAEVPLPNVPSTDLNESLLSDLCRSGRYAKVVVCGQASSHCVAFSCKDLVEHWPNYAGSRPLSDIILLEDGCSPVSGFEQAAQDFFQEMRLKGVTLAKCQDAKLKPSKQQSYGKK